MLSSKRIKDSIKDYPINEYPIKINFELYERLRHYLAFTCVNRSLRNHIDVKNILDDSDDLKSLNNSIECDLIIPQYLNDDIEVNVNFDLDRIDNYSYISNTLSEIELQIDAEFGDECRGMASSDASEILTLNISINPYKEDRDHPTVYDEYNENIHNLFETLKSNSKRTDLCCFVYNGEVPELKIVLSKLCEYKSDQGIKFYIFDRDNQEIMDKIILSLTKLFGSCSIPRLNPKIILNE